MLCPVKSQKPVAPDELLAMICCGCKTGCGKACSCRKTGIKCSVLCEVCCGASCTNCEDIVTELGEKECSNDREGTIAITTTDNNDHEENDGESDMDDYEHEPL